MSFGESLGTEMLSEDAVMDIGEVFLGLAWSQTLDKWCNKTPFVQGPFH